MTVLDRGAGGVSELRHAVEAYNENSPLYGFMQYRRRKVVLKYMPQDVSRLIQGTRPIVLYILDRYTNFLLAIMSTGSIADCFFLASNFSPERSPLPVSHREILAQRYRLLCFAGVRSHRRCTVVGLSFACGVGFCHFFVELTSPSQTDGYKRGCGGE